MQAHAYDRKSEDHLRYVSLVTLESPSYYQCSEPVIQMLYHPRTPEEWKAVNDGRGGGHTDYGYVRSASTSLLVWFLTRSPDQIPYSVILSKHCRSSNPYPVRRVEVRQAGSRWNHCQ